MSEQLVNNWLESFSSSALDYDLETHMAHIAQDVTVFGVLGFESLGYDDWYRQCEHEFPQQLIRELQYSDPVIRAMNDQSILFKTLETAATKDGGRLAQPLELLIEQRDGTWLLKQLRILGEDEARSDGLI